MIGGQVAEEENLIIFHFDLEDHALPLDQFIDTAKSAQAVIDVFNKEFCAGKLKYKINVVAPEEGGLIEILQLVGITVGAFWAFASSPPGAAFIVGATGHTPEYWAEKAGSRTKAATLMLTKMVMAFFKKKPEELQKIGFLKEKFRLAYQAKNKIYEDCLTNKEVRAIGFDRSHDFPIKRNDFARHIVELPAEEDEEDDLSWSVETTDILVNSPNWIRDDRRKWQAQTSKFKDVAFSIEDENFWHHVKIKDIQPDINDNMKVQWAHPVGNSKPTNVRVLKVLGYNGKGISKPLTEDELKQVLERYNIQENKEPELLDWDGDAGSQQDIDDENNEKTHIHQKY